MNETKIDWAEMSWNPVTGCRHGCPYCYARRTAHRFDARMEDRAAVGGLHVLDYHTGTSPLSTTRAGRASGAGRTVFRFSSQRRSRSQRKA